MLGAPEPAAYDRDHMPSRPEAADWPRWAAAQPLLALLPPALRAAGQSLTLAPGEVLFHAGDAVKKIHTVVRGEVRLVRHEAGGAEVVLQRARGGFVAEASLESRTYHCDAVAAEACEVLAFPVPVFRAALETELAFCRAWQGELSREVRRLRAQCERLCLKTAAGRVLHYIESEGRHGAVTLSQPRKAWAAELGLTHEALYRTLRRMQDEGLLRVDADTLRIVGPARARGRG